jgi:beta-glucosidase
MDLPSLALPKYKVGDKDVDQNAVIAAVAAVNPHTVVVLETGSPVTMPWVETPAAILETWYGGSDGANALGNILFGAVNPSGKLPNTFPRSDLDLPHPTILMPPSQVVYDEGVKVGYKWYDNEKKPVLFPFGYGLSYTSYRYSALSLIAGKTIKARFTLANTGARDGAEIAEVYAALPVSAQEPPKRLVGFSKVNLSAGEKQPLTVEIDPKYLSIFDESKNAWTLVPGDYTIMVGGSSQDLPLKAVLHLE